MRQLLCAVMCVSFLAIYAFSQTHDGHVVKGAKARIIKRNYADINEKQKWELNVNFPEIRKGNGELSEGFSKASNKIAMRQVSEFKSQMNGFSKEDRGFIPKEMKFSMDVSYSIEHFDEDFVSVNFIRSDFTGGAHPNHWSFTLNYDLKNNRVLSLTDLFKTKSDYLKVISSDSIRQIVKKQGKYAAPDWVKRGAEAKLKNFKSWNITKKGLKFTFDPYQVGSYAEGFYETIIPYQNFKFESQRRIFYSLAEVSYIDGNPPNSCRNGFFPRENVKFGSGVVKGRKNARAYFHRDDGECPDGQSCKGRAYVISGDRLLVSRKYGDYVCTWYQPRRGDETVGWIKAEKIKLATSVNTPRISGWLGTWYYGGNSITLKRDRKRGFIKINGDAVWKGLGDNIHIGEVDDRGAPKGNAIEIGGPDKYDCRVKMQLVMGLLLVADNMNCGGVNVTFSGVYRKTLR